VNCTKKKAKYTKKIDTTNLRYGMEKNGKY